MTEGLRTNKAINLPEWERQVKAWEADHSLPCPYVLPEQSWLLLCACRIVLMLQSGVTLASVKKRLATEDHREAKRQGPEEEDTMAEIGMTANSFIIEGIDLEESQ